MTTGATTQDLFNALAERLGLEWVSGREGADRPLTGEFPGARGQGLVGMLNVIHPNRIQLVGRAELKYFAQLEPDFYRDMVEKLFAANPAAVILVDGIGIDRRFLDLAERTLTPLLCSALPDNRLLSDLQYYLTQVLAERKTEHGVFMEVLGIGVLLTGSAAVGKSELALELINRGHRLVADDAPRFARVAPDLVRGSCPPLLQDFLEVRGIGILDIRTMFGDSAIKPQKSLGLIVRLKPMDEAAMRAVDRLKGSHSTRNILGLEIPEVTIPVAPGREMAILVEAAVRQHNLREKGYDAAEHFIARQQRAIVDETEADPVEAGRRRVKR